MSFKSKIRDAVYRAEKWAASVEDEVSSFIVEGKTIFSYTGFGVIPALVSSFMMRILIQDPHYTVMPATDAALHVAPYREWSFRVLLYTSSSWERGEIARLADALYIMNVPFKFIMEKPSDPILSSKVPSECIVEVPEGIDPILPEVLLSAKSSLKASIKLSGRGDLRVSRLENEFREFTPIVDELLEEYDDAIRKLEEYKSCSSILIASTTSMMPVALALYRAYSTAGVTPIILNASVASALPPRSDAAVIVYSSVEFDSARDLWYRLFRAGFKNIIRFEVKTDPLSAPVYGVIVAEVLREDLSKAS